MTLELRNRAPCRGGIDHLPDAPWVEGVIDHLILGVHHVNETVAREQWLWWDLAFLLWGAAMIAVGWALLRPVARS